ncbi:MAG: glycosyltransferase family 4 protein [Patescibacteria group bacterium]
MTIHNICVCHNGTLLSGGEKFTYEVIPRWAKKFPSINYFYFSEPPREWEIDYKIKTINVSSEAFKENGTLRVLLFYFVAFFRSLKIIRKFDSEKNIIISHSSAWPDVLIAFLFKYKNPQAHWLAISHSLYYPNPFFYQWLYIKKSRIPSLAEIYKWLVQEVFFILQKKADLLAGGNSIDKEKLLTKNKNVHIIRYGGEYKGKPEFNIENKIYDICFLGRFTEPKGVLEVPEILNNLKKICDKKISAIFIARQDNYAGWLENKLKPLGYDIKFLGAKYGEEKYDLLKKSKILIFPSYFESFGLVYLDAISVGTPVAEYDIPCLNTTHTCGVIKAPFKDNYAFAQNLKKLLTDQSFYQKLAKEGYEYSQTFDLDITAGDLERYFPNL